ncbi:MAG: hypothetical protein GXP44_01270 [bacterium]|nr:hypothetical protein [bacterium]
MLTLYNREDDEIKKLHEEWPKISYEKKVDKFLWKMVWFHHEKHIPGSPSKPINELNETIKKASDSSEKLTNSIRTATWVAAIIGGLALLVAAISLLKDFGVFDLK